MGEGRAKESRWIIGFRQGMPKLDTNFGDLKVESWADYWNLLRAAQLEVLPVKGSLQVRGQVVGCLTRRYQQRQ